MRQNFSTHALNDLKRDNPVHVVAGGWVNLRKSNNTLGYVGPCPLCSPDKNKATSTRFECNSDKWVCAACCQGGDVISLVMQGQSLNFNDAVQWLGGIKERALTENDAKLAGAVAFKAGAETNICPPDYAEFADAYKAGFVEARLKKQKNDKFRDDERLRLYEVWRTASRINGSIAAHYLEKRGLIVPQTAKLRSMVNYRYYNGTKEDQYGKKRPVIVHTGPAMLAAIIANDGRFAGMHATYIDLDNANKFKAVISDSQTGEVLPAKKSRGGTKGCHIELLPHVAPKRLFLGEGIETCLTVYTALVKARRDLTNCAFWSSIDLHNLGGAHATSVAHPTLKTKTGRPQKIPSDEPDYKGSHIEIPDSVQELIILGDGDSEGVLTQNTVRRAAARYAKRGRRIVIVMSPEGEDFNDMVMKPLGAA